MLTMEKLNKLTQREFGTTSKHDLWNRIKELEDYVQCLTMDKQYILDDLTEVSFKLTCVSTELQSYKEKCAQKDKQIQYLLIQLTK